MESTSINNRTSQSTTTSRKALVTAFIFISSCGSSASIPDVAPHGHIPQHRVRSAHRNVPYHLTHPWRKNRPQRRRVTLNLNSYLNPSIEISMQGHDTHRAQPDMDESDLEFHHKERDKIRWKLRRNGKRDVKFTGITERDITSIPSGLVDSVIESDRRIISNEEHEDSEVENDKENPFNPVNDENFHDFITEYCYVAKTYDDHSKLNTTLTTYWLKGNGTSTQISNCNFSSSFNISKNITEDIPCYFFITKIFDYQLLPTQHNIIRNDTFKDPFFLPPCSLAKKDTLSINDMSCYSSINGTYSLVQTHHDEYKEHLPICPLNPDYKNLQIGAASLQEEEVGNNVDKTWKCYEYKHKNVLSNKTSGNFFHQNMTNLFLRSNQTSVRLDLCDRITWNFNELSITEYSSVNSFSKPCFFPIQKLLTLKYNENVEVENKSANLTDLSRNISSEAVVLVFNNSATLLMECSLKDTTNSSKFSNTMSNFCFDTESEYFNTTATDSFMIRLNGFEKSLPVCNSSNQEENVDFNTYPQNETIPSVTSSPSSQESYIDSSVTSSPSTQESDTEIDGNKVEVKWATGFIEPKDQKDIYNPVRMKAALTSHPSSGSSFLSESKQSYLLEKILTPALSAWSKSLSVIPVHGNLTIDAKQLYDGKSCGPGIDSGLPSVVVPKDHLMTGVKNTDVLIYLSVAFFDESVDEKINETNNRDDDQVDIVANIDNNITTLEGKDEGVEGNQSQHQGEEIVLFNFEPKPILEKQIEHENHLKTVKTSSLKGGMPVFGTTLKDLNGQSSNSGKIDNPKIESLFGNLDDDTYYDDTNAHDNGRPSISPSNPSSIIFMDLPTSIQTTNIPSVISTTVVPFSVHGNTSVGSNGMTSSKPTKDFLSLSPSSFVSYSPSLRGTNTTLQSINGTNSIHNSNNTNTIACATKNINLTTFSNQTPGNFSPCNFTSVEETEFSNMTNEPSISATASSSQPSNPHFSLDPSQAYSQVPTFKPSKIPTVKTTFIPTNIPASMQKKKSSISSTRIPSDMPTYVSTSMSTNTPSKFPTLKSNKKATRIDKLTSNPTFERTSKPTNNPTTMPTESVRPSCSGSYLASATYCSTDQWDRPIAGMLHFCITPDFFSEDKLQENIVTAMHELAHILGFNTQSMAHFREAATGIALTPRDENGDVEDVEIECTGAKESRGSAILPLPSEKIMQFQEVRGGERVAQIITPTVSQIVKNHFDCSDLDGAELESEIYHPVASSSSYKESDSAMGICISDHWSRRLFKADLMNPIISDVPHTSRISPLTLAFFLDSGWYKINVEQSLIANEWGRGAGCEFAQNKCITHNGQVTAKNSQFFCNSLLSTSSEESIEEIHGCTSDLKRKAVCSMSEFNSNLPLEHQYFSNDKNLGPRFGGSDVSLDYCPFFQGFSNGLCTDRENERFIKVNDMEKFGIKNSRCIVGRVDNVKTSLCLPIACVIEDQTLRVNVDGSWKVCNYAGQMISSRWDRTNYVVCPDPRRICPTFHCPRNCLTSNGAGLCDNDSGECLCAVGKVISSDLFSAQTEVRVVYDNCSKNDQSISFFEDARTESSISEYYFSSEVELEDTGDDIFDKTGKMFSNMSVTDVIGFVASSLLILFACVVMISIIFRLYKVGCYSRFYDVMKGIFNYFRSSEKSIERLHEWRVDALWPVATQNRNSNKDKMVASILVNMRVHDNDIVEEDNCGECEEKKVSKIQRQDLPLSYIPTEREVQSNNLVLRSDLPPLPDGSHVVSVFGHSIIEDIISTNQDDGTSLATDDITFNDRSSTNESNEHIIEDTYDSKRRSILETRLFSSSFWRIRRRQNFLSIEEET